MKKVYFEHKGGTDSIKAVDCFVKSEKDFTEKECEELFEIDYFVNGCIFVDNFLKSHKEYKYVGSTDSGHLNGYAMNLDDWKKIDTPIINEVN